MTLEGAVVESICGTAPIEGADRARRIRKAARPYRRRATLSKPLRGDPSTSAAFAQGDTNKRRGIERRPIAQPAKIPCVIPSERRASRGIPARRSYGAVSWDRSSLVARRFEIRACVAPRDSLFGGGPSLPPNYYVYEHRLRHNRHPLYDEIIGVSDDLVPTQGSEAWPDGNVQPSNTPPLQRPGYIIPAQFHGYNYCGSGNNGGSTTPGTTDACCEAHDKCYGDNLSGKDVVRHFHGSGASSKQRKCDQALCACVKALKPTSNPYDLLMRFGITATFCY